MKLSEIARYSAARAFPTRIDSAGGRVEFRASFACPAFTLECSPEKRALSRNSAPPASTRRR